MQGSCLRLVPLTQLAPSPLQSFFERWWRQQDEDTRALVTRLVQDGQVCSWKRGRSTARVACLCALGEVESCCIIAVAALVKDCCFTSFLHSWSLSTAGTCSTTRRRRTMWA